MHRPKPEREDWKLYQRFIIQERYIITQVARRSVGLVLIFRSTSMMAAGRTNMIAIAIL